MAHDVEQIRERLRAVADELADLAIERLRQAVNDDDTASAVAAERRLTKARRAVDKAIAVLDDVDGPEGR